MLIRLQNGSFVNHAHVSVIDIDMETDVRIEMISGSFQFVKFGDKGAAESYVAQLVAIVDQSQRRGAP